MSSRLFRNGNISAWFPSEDPYQGTSKDAPQPTFLNNFVEPSATCAAYQDHSSIKLNISDDTIKPEVASNSYDTSEPEVPAAANVRTGLPFDDDIDDGEEPVSDISDSKSTEQGVTSHCNDGSAPDGYL